MEDFIEKGKRHSPSRQDILIQAKHLIINRKSYKQIMKTQPLKSIATQRNRAMKKKILRSSVVCSWSQNLCHSFHSKYTTTDRFGAIFHNLQFAQFARRSITLLGITQTNPTLPKKSFHKALAIAKWSKRWFTDFTLFMHLQHQSAIMIGHFLRFSVVRIFLKKAFQAKTKLLLQVPQLFKYPFKENCYYSEK